MNLLTYEEIIESLGSHPQDMVANLERLSFEKFGELVETLSFSLPSTIIPKNSFSFTSNGSLSGGRFPCASHKCRLQKIDELSSFAALYADHVFVQNPFDVLLVQSSCIPHFTT